MGGSFVLGTDPLDFDALDARCEPLRGALEVESRIFVHARDRVAWLAALRLGESLRLNVVAMPSGWSSARIADAISGLGAGQRLSFDVERNGLSLQPVAGASTDDISPGIVIFTTGTTGAPKAVSHSWQSIAAPSGYVAERLHGCAWYLAYEPAGYAGLQVYFAARQGGGRLVVPPVDAGFRDYPRGIIEHGVEVISATPTWWRSLIVSWPATLPFPRLRQATLGGEVVDQRTLDLVRDCFRPERLTHIFASSEVGTAIIVSDGLAGFPAEWLDAPRRVRLRISDGELEVWSPFAMRGYLGEGVSEPEERWFPTGDLVALRGSRCHIVGRRDQRLNIGGAKVTPEEVEAILLEIEDIAECFVYGKANPIVGTLLAADLVAAAGKVVDLRQVRDRLASRLAPHMVPRYLRVVDSIRVSGSGKKQRA